MIQQDDDEIVLKKKANLFYNLQEVVHVKYKNGFWKRGIIVEVSADFFMIDERVEGKVPVFFLEIRGIEKYFDKGGIKKE